MNATKNGWTVGSAGWTAVALFAVSTIWPQAAAQQRTDASPQKLRINTIIERLEQGGVASSDVAQYIDMEHRPYLIDELRAIFDEADKQRKPNGQLEKTPIVRIPMYGDENPSWLVKQVLDIGALGIVFPQISTKEEALRAIRAMRIPPQKGGKYPNPPGIRGAGIWSVDSFTGMRLWGKMGPDEYIRRADLWPLNPEGELFAYLMIETREGVKNINEILDVPGIGGIRIGANDLSFNLGVGRQSGQGLAPETEEAVNSVLRACLAKKVMCGIAGYGGAATTRQELIKRGFKVLI